MKKLIFALVMMCFATTSVFAQKYMTRTGKVTFFSATPLENIEAINNEMASVIDGKTGDVIFVVPVKSFKFERALMQEHFNENYMESDRFPKADFKGRIVSFSEVNLQKDGNYAVKVAGKLTIHGVTRDVTLPGTVNVKGGTVTATSKFSVVPSDYGIKIPSVVEGKIAKQIEVTVNSILERK